MYGGEGTNPDWARCIQLTRYWDCKGFVPDEEHYYWDHRKESVQLCYPHASPNLGAVLLNCRSCMKKCRTWAIYTDPYYRVKATLVTQSASCLHLPLFSGDWWQPYTPPFGPKFRIAEMILLTWGENSLHHCWWDSAVAGLQHSETASGPLLFSKCS